MPLTTEGKKGGVDMRRRRSERSGQRKKDEKVETHFAVPNTCMHAMPEAPQVSRKRVLLKLQVSLISATRMRKQILKVCVQKAWLYIARSVDSFTAPTNQHVVDGYLTTMKQLKLVVPLARKKRCMTLRRVYVVACLQSRMEGTVIPRTCKKIEEPLMQPGERQEICT
jgi:hypothetical protein